MRPLSLGGRKERGVIGQSAGLDFPFTTLGDSHGETYAERDETAVDVFPLSRE